MAELDDDELTERLLDLLVYAPIGLALEAKDLLPQLAERGRGQVALTRLASAMATPNEMQDAAEKVAQFLSMLESFLAGAEADAEPDQHPPEETGQENELPIDGYDDMTAVKAIEAIGGLTPEQLDIVEKYERSHRNRVTVLNRIEQLRSS